ncbi:RNA binding protein protein, putative [Babesia ovis]|uniref:RNA binding protein protein, putative n=1 Tax=Babesia ovis TaxID=5869 RepID=A0A9W5TCF0_BABOV|nr:RNA binding protein protein, putative [Babesia ovis]
MARRRTWRTIGIVSSCLLLGAVATIVGVVLLHPNFWDNESDLRSKEKGATFAAVEKLERITKKPLLIDRTNKRHGRAIEIINQFNNDIILYRLKPAFKETHYINQVVFSGIDTTINPQGATHALPNDEIIYVHYHQANEWTKVAVHYRAKGKVHIDDYLREREDGIFKKVKGPRVPTFYRALHIDTLELGDQVMAKMMMQNAHGLSLITPAHRVKVSTTKASADGDNFHVTLMFEYGVPSESIVDAVIIEFEVNDDTFSHPEVSKHELIKVAEFDDGSYKLKKPSREQVEHIFRSKYIIIDGNRQHILRYLIVVNKDNASVAKVYLILYNDITSIISCAVVGGTYTFNTWVVGNSVMEQYDLPSTNFQSARVVIPGKGKSRPVLYPENTKYAHEYQDYRRYHVDGIPFGKYNTFEIACAALEEENAYGGAYQSPSNTRGATAQPFTKHRITLELEKEPPREINKISLKPDDSVEYYTMGEQYLDRHIFYAVKMGVFEFTLYQTEEIMVGQDDAITAVKHTHMSGWNKVDIQFVRNGKSYMKQYVRTPESSEFVEITTTDIPSGNVPNQLDLITHKGIVVLKTMLQNSSGASLFDANAKPSILVQYKNGSHGWGVAYSVPIVIPGVSLQHRLQLKLTYDDNGIAVERAVQFVLQVVQRAGEAVLETTKSGRSIGSRTVWLNRQYCNVIQHIIVPNSAESNTGFLYTFIYIRVNAGIGCVVRYVKMVDGHWEQDEERHRVFKDHSGTDVDGQEYIDVYTYPSVNYAPVTLVIPDLIDSPPLLNPPSRGEILTVRKDSIFVVNLIHDSESASVGIHQHDLKWMNAEGMPRLPVELNLHEPIKLEVQVRRLSDDRVVQYTIKNMFKKTHFIDSVVYHNIDFAVDKGGADDGIGASVIAVFLVHSGESETMRIHYSRDGLSKVVYYHRDGKGEFKEVNGFQHELSNGPAMITTLTVGDGLILNTLLQNEAGDALVDMDKKPSLLAYVGDKDTPAYVKMILPIKLASREITGVLNLAFVINDGKGLLKLPTGVVDCSVMQRDERGKAYLAPAVGKRFREFANAHYRSMLRDGLQLLKVIIVPQNACGLFGTVYSFVYDTASASLSAIVHSGNVRFQVWSVDTEPIDVYSIPLVNVDHLSFIMPKDKGVLPLLSPEVPGVLTEIDKGRVYGVNLALDEDIVNNYGSQPYVSFFSMKEIVKTPVRLDLSKDLPGEIQKRSFGSGNATQYELKWQYKHTHFISKLVYENITLDVVGHEGKWQHDDGIVSIDVIKNDEGDCFNAQYIKGGINRYEQYQKGSNGFEALAGIKTRTNVGMPYQLTQITSDNSIVIRVMLENTEQVSLLDEGSEALFMSNVGSDVGLESVILALPLKYPTTSVTDRLHISLVYDNGKLVLHHPEHIGAVYNVLMTDENRIERFAAATEPEYADVSDISTITLEGQVRKVIRGTVVADKETGDRATIYFFIYDGVAGIISCVTSRTMLVEGVYQFTGIFDQVFDLPPQNVSQVRVDVSRIGIKPYNVYPRDAGSVSVMDDTDWYVFRYGNGSVPVHQLFNPNDTTFIAGTGIRKMSIVIDKLGLEQLPEVEVTPLKESGGMYYRVRPIYRPTHRITEINIEGLNRPVFDTVAGKEIGERELIYVHTTNGSGWEKLALYGTMNGNYFFKEYVRSPENHEYQPIRVSELSVGKPPYVFSTITRENQVAMKIHLQNAAGLTLIDAEDVSTVAFRMMKTLGTGILFVALPIVYPNTAIKDRLYLKFKMAKNDMRYVRDIHTLPVQYAVEFRSDGNYSFVRAKDVKYANLIAYDGSNLNTYVAHSIIKSVLVPEGGKAATKARLYVFAVDTEARILKCFSMAATLENGVWELGKLPEERYIYPTSALSSATISIKYQKGTNMPVIFPEDAGQVREVCEDLFLVKQANVDNAVELHPMDVEKYASMGFPMIPVTLDLSKKLPVEMWAEVGEMPNVTLYKLKAEYEMSHFIHKFKYLTIDQVVQTSENATIYRNGSKYGVVKHDYDTHEIWFIETPKALRRIDEFTKKCC